jgi:hypothetical protein
MQKPEVKFKEGDAILAIVDIRKGGTINMKMPYPVAQIKIIEDSYLPAFFYVHGGGYYRENEVVKLPTLGCVLWAKEISNE